MVKVLNFASSTDCDVTVAGTGGMIMGKTFDIIALGELLVDFTYAGTSENGMTLFEQNPGGAPANMLTAASHMKRKTGFIGKVGTDMHGVFLKQTLDREGINTDGLVMDDQVFTTLAFVGIGAGGEREFSFARKPGADTLLRPEELNRDLLRDCRIFHVGSLSLTNEPARSATIEALRLASDAGAMISYDPNYRASLWCDHETAKKEISSLIPYTDIMKVSDEESYLITGEPDYKKAAKQILEQGPKVLAITLGSDGVYTATREGGCHVPAFPVQAIDTTGAGDCFWGGFLSGYLGSGKTPDELQTTDLAQFARFGNGAAALCVQKRGGIPSIPFAQAVRKLIGI